MCQSTLRHVGTWRYILVYWTTTAGLAEQIRVSVALSLEARVPGTCCDECWYVPEKFWAWCLTDGLTKHLHISEYNNVRHLAR